jgi:hypothetical protein
MKDIEIVIRVNPQGNASYKFPGTMTALEASIVISQVAVQLQAQAAQQAGIPILAAPGPIRMS